MICVSIGSIVDFIHVRARMRGIVVTLDNGIVMAAVLGYGIVNKPLDDVVPVSDSYAVVEALR